MEECTISLIAWFKLDEDVKDSSGNVYDGDNYGVAFGSGKVDEAGEFERANKDYIQLPSSLLATNGLLSFAFWINSAFANTEVFFAEGTQSSGGYISVLSYGKGLSLQYYGNGAPQNSVQTDFFLGYESVWVLVIITVDYNNEEIKFYRNNSLINTVAMASPVVLPPARVHYIGEYDAGIHANAFNGSLDNFKIFDHLLSSDERFAEFSGDQYIIGGWAYAKEFRDGDINQTALFRLRTGEILLSDDSNNTIVSRIANGQDVHIYNNYSLIFRGLIENFVFDEDKTITIDIIDYSFYLAEDFITYTATSKLASTIVDELIDAYGNNLFGKNITATAFVYSSKTWRAYSPIEIIQELALDEGYVFFVDENRVFNFVPQNFNDTGITLVDGTTIFSRSFPHDNTKLKNKIFIIGKGATDTAGIRVVARDPGSIAQYGKRTKRIEDTSIETEDQAIERANVELTRLANPLIIGTLDTARNFLLSAGSIMRVTLSQKSWTAKEFLILEAEHELELPVSHLTLAEINPLNSDQLGELLFKQRLTAKNWEDDAVPVTQYERWTEEIEVEMLLYVETQNTATSRDWNEFEYNSSVDWDLVPGSWSVIINGEVMGLTTLGLNRLRDLIVGKVVTDFSSTNANIAIGSGTTPFTIADTALETEDYRKTMDSGFPRDGTITGENEHQSSWDDGNFSSGSFDEIGILDNVAGGLLLARAVPTSPFSKGANENLRVRSKLRFFQ